MLGDRPAGGDLHLAKDAGGGGRCFHAAFEREERGGWSHHGEREREQGRKVGERGGMCSCCAQDLVEGA